jgi:hypothetical protein
MHNIWILRAYFSPPEEFSSFFYIISLFVRVFNSNVIFLGHYFSKKGVFISKRGVFSVKRGVFCIKSGWLVEIT